MEFLSNTLSQGTNFLKVNTFSPFPPICCWSGWEKAHFPPHFLGLGGEPFPFLGEMGARFFSFDMHIRLSRDILGAFWIYLLSKIAKSPSLAPMALTRQDMGDVFEGVGGAPKTNNHEPVRLAVSKIRQIWSHTRLHNRRCFFMKHFWCILDVFHLKNLHILLAPLARPKYDILMMYDAAKHRYIRGPVRLVVSKMQLGLRFKNNVFV